MEKEGLVRRVKKLTDYGLSIDVLVTDRHRQIAKWIRENLSNVTHYFDVWHVAKGMCTYIWLLINMIHRNSEEVTSLSETEGL